MDSQKALNFINRVLSEKRKPILNSVEESLFLGIWENQSYDYIAAKINMNSQHTRVLGGKLFTKLKQDLGIIVEKRNFQNPIKYFYQEYSSNSAPGIPNIEITEIEPSSPLNNQNPFVPITGKVDDNKQFFGREKEIKEIFELLNNASSVAIIGEQAIGKSSLLYAVSQQSVNLLSSPRQNVFLDMNIIHNQEDFYFAICEKLDIPDNKGYRFTRDLENKKVLLILDNVGKLNGVGFTRDVRDHLRGLAEGENACLKLVLAANESLETLFNDSYETSPLSGICQQVDIQPWNEKTSRDFIAKRLQPTTIDFTEADIQELIQESGGHPQKLTQLCYDLYKAKTL
ncbi:ATP-binding protein [Dolichospermum circinale]|uniref:nSTAND1 domain-containing NTPase n=1 Tax=Dolichospermum circinale TaxID=109265 RepID=UPI0004262B29|nr:ATP-binding protein [Dolichospermum circinale]MDB9475206.1 ATP-binding protein [Dolichospermum circinale CS-537/11]MDB9479625.1 ATP-binding protein [Dolichospermum circinale CS-537/03]MDB9482704.1 ATP-binding protein [Dolichospermum circinale CS-537/05]MDB9492485.1 ATP-binding protein [Dolichospermum circinale CS-534/05]